MSYGQGCDGDSAICGPQLEWAYGASVFSWCIRGGVRVSASFDSLTSVVVRSRAVSLTLAAGF